MQIILVPSSTAVVVDMTDPVSIEMAATWKQHFVNKVSHSQLVVDRKDGFERTRIEPLYCDPLRIPVLLLGNKYDLVREPVMMLLDVDVTLGMMLVCVHWNNNTLAYG